VVEEVRLERRVAIHQRRAPAERADREAAADRLPHRGEIRRDSVELLRAAEREPQRDNLVEDQQPPVPRGLVAQVAEEALGRREEAARHERGVDDDRGDVVAVLLHDARDARGVVVDELDDVIAGTRDDPGGRVAAPHLEVVVGAVVGALRLRDLRAAGRGARGAHRHHHRLGAGVREAHALHGGDALDEQLRELRRPRVRRRPAGAARDLARDGLDDRGVGVPQDHRRHVRRAVEVTVAVNVLEVGAGAALDHERVGAEEDRVARVAAGHRRARPLVPLAALRGALAVAALGLLAQRVERVRHRQHPPRAAAVSAWSGA